MATSAKPGARQKMIDFVISQGWELDTGVQMMSSRYSSAGTMQDPHAFTKPAAHGGRWQLRFKYQPKSSYGPHYDNTLRKVEVRFIDDNEAFFNWNLYRPGQYDYFNPLWVALGTQGETIAVKAKRLVADPDTALWLAFQAEHDHNLQRREERRLHRLDVLERSKPLPIRVGQGYGKGQWRGLVFDLTAATQALSKADGKSDLPKLVADAQLRLNEIIDALTDEASLEFAEHIGMLSDAERM